MADPAWPKGSMDMGHENPGKKRQQDEGKQPAQQSRRDMHPAGPHARPELTNNDATPGTGALPDVTESGDVDPGSE